MDVGGGFVAPSYSLKPVPAFSLYGDGRLIIEGPQIEIYPGPALPNLLVTRISEDGVQAILSRREGRRPPRARPQLRLHDASQTRRRPRSR